MVNIAHFDSRPCHHRLKTLCQSIEKNSINDGKAVWSYGNTIYIRVEKDDIDSIYSIAGQLVKRLEISEGSSSIQMERGVYIITLKDGSVHKVILK